MVHLARHEGFGLVVAEALVSGVPVVATDVGGIAEILHGTPCGVIRFGDWKSMLESIERWLNPIAKDRELLSDAALTAHSRFSDDRRSREIESYLKVYVKWSVI